MGSKIAINQNQTNLFYHFVVFITVFFIFLNNSPGNAWGANVYIDPDWGGTESGTCSEPYSSWSDIVFSASNDYYQKCGTTEHRNTNISIHNITGSSSNRVIIGAYYKKSASCIVGVSGAKPIINRNNTSGSAIFADTSTYLQFENLDLRGGQSTLFLIDGTDYAVIKNSSVGSNSSGWGVRMQTCDKGKIYNCVIDSNNTNKTFDGIFLGSAKVSHASKGWEIFSNRLLSWEHTQISIGVNSDDNHIYNNYFDGSTCTADDPCRGFEIYGTAEENHIHHNYIYNFNAHSQILSSSNNFIYYNIFDTVRTPATEAFMIQCNTSYNSIGNKFSNNVIYNSNGYGLAFWVTSGKSGIIKDNEIKNNVFLAWESGKDGIKIPALPGMLNNIFKNNIYYSSGDSTIVYYRGNRKTISQWMAANGNAHGEVVIGELNSDPSLKNPADKQFWPDSISDPVVRTGINTGSLFNQILVQDGTDFTASPPIVKMEEQPVDWFIGAYALDIQKKPGKPEPEKISNFHVKSKEEENTN